MKIPHIPRKVMVLGALGVAAAVGVVSIGTANAQTDDSTTSNPTKPATGDNADMPKCDRPRREPLDEATTAKVKAAALAAVEGATFNKAHKNRAGGYAALLTKADGTTRVLVRVDKDFKVTEVVDPAPARPRRARMHREFREQMRERNQAEGAGASI